MNARVDFALLVIHVAIHRPSRAQELQPADHWEENTLGPYGSMDLFHWELETGRETRLSRGGGCYSPSMDRQGKLYFLTWARNNGQPMATLRGLPLKAALAFAQKEGEPVPRDAEAWTRLAEQVLKEAKGYFGRKHSSYRFAKEQVQRSGMYSYRDRRNKKRTFRRLWITRINAAARMEGMSYSELMHGLNKAEVEVNRKMLADIAVHDRDAFRRFVELAREGAAA